MSGNGFSEETLEKLFDQLTQTEDIQSILIDGEKNEITADAKIENPLLLCGSFNPLHEGHIKLLDAADKKIRSSQTNSYTQYFQFCTTNCDKVSWLI